VAVANTAARRRGAIRVGANRWALLVLPAVVFLLVFFLAPLLDMSSPATRLRT
jgi:hypothetical protein